MLMAGKKRIIILGVINVVLYVGFVTLDILGAKGVSVTDISPSNEMKYATIVSCLLITIFSYFLGKRNSVSAERLRAAHVQSIVFGITLVADFFLLFTDYFVIGVIVFLFAHSVALYRYNPGWVPFLASISGALCIASLVIMGFYHSDKELLYFALLCSAYAVLIIGVFVSTFHTEQPRINTLLSRIGMILFIGCDINVFLSNFLHASSVFFGPALILMWVFYLPAQTLLALSVVSFSKDKLSGSPKPGT